MAKLQIRKQYLREPGPLQDLFEWGPMLGTLRTAVESLETPGCIAVYGSWGAGKTHAMSLVRQQLIDAKEHVTVWFDPWEYEQTGDVITPLIASITRQLEPNHERKEEFWRYAVALAKTIGGLSLSVGATLAGLGKQSAEDWKAILELKPADMLKELLEPKGRPIDKVEAAKEAFRALVKTGLDAREKASPDVEPRLVVFLDDLDRCLPDTVVNLVEAVKLLLCGHYDARVVFVFGLDRTIVGEAIAKRYTGSWYSGESYLEKIFDLTVEVPRVDARKLERQLLSVEDDLWSHLLEPLTSPAIANPRVILRTISRLGLFVSQGLLKELAARPGDLRKLCAWIAGADRYRSFRTSFFDLTAGELRAIHDVAFPPNSPSADAVRSESVIRLLAAPGFLAYYRTLFGNAGRPPTFEALLAERVRKSPPGDDSYDNARAFLANDRSMTLAEIDHALRIAGL